MACVCSLRRRHRGTTVTDQETFFEEGTPSPATCPWLSNTSHQLTSHVCFHRYAALRPVPFSIRFRAASIFVNARRAAFAFHRGLSGLSQDITPPGEICSLAIVGPLIPLFASWPVMRRGRRRVSAVADGLQKKLQ